MEVARSEMQHVDFVKKYEVFFREIAAFIMRRFLPTQPVLMYCVCVAWMLSCAVDAV